MKVDPFTFHLVRKLLAEAGLKAWHMKGGAAAFKALTKMSNDLVSFQEVVDHHPGKVPQQPEGADSGPLTRTDNL